MRLSDCFIELIAYVVYFLKTVTKHQPSFDQTRSDIERLMSLSHENIFSFNVSEDDYNAARFAICAWADEAIMNSAWNEKLRWQKEPLQRLYYQTMNAGELFFDRLNAIAPHQNGVREVYYLCLAMGFMGRYGNADDAYLLDQLKTSNLKVLLASSVGIPSFEKGELFPESYPTKSEVALSERKSSRFSLFTISCLGLPVLLYWVLFILYRFILHNIGENIISVVP
jgi:type VI secretion system protein ImpK